MEQADSDRSDWQVRRMTAQEFARRLRHLIVRQSTNVVWFLGAGCSVSSGVPSARTMAEGWLAELMYLESGERPADAAGLERWAEARFAQYVPGRAETVYAPLLETLFLTRHERAREIERQLAGAEPGFGYATLAQMMTDNRFPGRMSLALTSNFDDLMADALHLYSQRRPEVLTPEALTPKRVLGGDTPTILKLQGDAHLELIAGANAPSYPPAVAQCLRGVLSDAALLMIGYGGRDHAIADLIEGLPANAPQGGVYWISDQPPATALRVALMGRPLVWVQHREFDEVMYLVRLEFGLGHPRIERFERILKKYESQFRVLNARTDLRIAPEVTTVKATEEKATEAPTEAPELTTPETLGHPTTEDRRARLRRSLDAFARAIGGAGKVSSKPASPPPLARPAATGEAGFLGVEAALTSLARTVAAEKKTEADPQAAMISRAVDELAAKARHRGAGAARWAHLPLPDAPLDPKSRTQAEAAYAKALAEAPTDPALLSRHARFLERGAGDIDAAARAYAAAASQAGADIPTLRAAANFVLEHFADVDQAEKLLRRALAADLRDAGTLRQVARLLLDWRGDLSGAETCLRLAFEGPRATAGAETARARFEYAELLADRRAQYRQAEPHFLEAIKTDPALAARYGLRLLAMGNVSAAGQQAETAIRAAPAAAETLLLRAALLEALEDLDGAETLYRAAAMAVDANGRERLALASFLVERRHDLNAAEERLLHALERFPRSARLLSGYARFLAEKRHDEEAAHEFHDRALACGPTRLDSLLPAARAALPRDIARARDLLKRAQAVAPNSAEVLALLAQVAESAGDADAALSHATQTLKATVSDLEATRAEAEEAEKLLRQAIEMRPDAPTLNRFVETMAETRAKLDAPEVGRNEVPMMARAAQFLLAEGRQEEGLALLDQAFARMATGNTAAPLLLEMWICRYAHDATQRPKALKAALALIDGGARSEGWDFSANIDRALRDGHPAPATLRALVRVAAMGADPAELMVVIKRHVA